MCKLLSYYRNFNFSKLSVSALVYLHHCLHRVRVCMCVLFVFWFACGEHVENSKSPKTIPGINVRELKICYRRISDWFSGELESGLILNNNVNNVSHKQVKFLTSCARRIDSRTSRKRSRAPSNVRSTFTVRIVTIFTRGLSSFGRSNDEFCGSR